MITVTQQYSVNAPVDKVFAYISNPKNDKEWQASCQDVILPEGETLKAGTTYEIVFRFLGRNMPFQSAITAYELDKSFGYETLTGPMKFRGHYTFEPSPEGTRVDWTFEADPGKFFGIVPIGLVKKIFVKQVEADINRLKSILNRQQQVA
ncbi:SRPBCC family protein [Methylocaldum sp. MU1018]